MARAAGLYFLRSGRLESARCAAETTALMPLSASLYLYIFLLLLADSRPAAALFRPVLAVMAADWRFFCREQSFFGCVKRPYYIIAHLVKGERILAPGRHSGES